MSDDGLNHCGACGHRWVEGNDECPMCLLIANEDMVRRNRREAELKYVAHAVGLYSHEEAKAIVGKRLAKERAARRDMFAAAALTGILAGKWTDPGVFVGFGQYAAAAWEFADEMLKADGRKEEA